MVVGIHIEQNLFFLSKGPLGHGQIIFRTDDTPASSPKLGVAQIDLSVTYSSPELRGSVDWCLLKRGRDYGVGLYVRNESALARC